MRRDHLGEKYPDSKKAVRHENDRGNCHSGRFAGFGLGGIFFRAGARGSKTCQLLFFGRSMPEDTAAPLRTKKGKSGGKLQGL
jgi:hypothetical protein